MMRAYLRQHHVGLIALLLVLLSGGSAYAAATIGAADIERDAVRSKHIKDGKVSGSDVNEPSLEVSRVVVRASSNASTPPLTPVATPYSLSQNWTQAPNESVIGFVGNLTFQRIGECTNTVSINVHVFVDGQLLGTATALTPPIPGSSATFATLSIQSPLFEPGAAIARALTVEVSRGATPCSPGGDVTLQSMALSLIGVR